ncbi:MAG TPA: SCO family protein [Allosphingosinicella sp.]|nr:SCO family protein [Allosphingosinicella sp.]
MALKAMLLGRSAALLCAALLGAGTLASGCSEAAAERPPLEGARLGGPFSLTDHNGRKFSSASLDGKYRIVYFGFTYCPDVCPVDLQAIGQALRQMEKRDPELAAKVQPVFITVDPERDTPAVMKDYVAAFHPRLIGLTGSPGQIAGVAKAHGVYFDKQQDKPSDYMVDHSRIALLFGPKGDPIAILPHEQGADAIAAELRKWVR